MRYDEGLHGIFRDSSTAPRTRELIESKRAYDKEHPEYNKTNKNELTFFAVLFVGLLSFIICLVNNMANIAMIIVGVLATALTIINLKKYNNPNIPKPEKNPLDLCIIVGGAALITIIYNILCLVGLFGGEIDNGACLGLVIGWIGLSYFVCQLLFGIRMNTRCSESTEAYCIGFADSISSGDERHRDYVVSRAVYEFDYCGKTYTVIGHRKTNLSVLLPQINERAYIRFDPENPEFCMIKQFELAAFVKCLIIGGLGILFCVNIVKSNIINKNKIPAETNSGIYVIDENGHAVPAEQIQTIETIVIDNNAQTASETTEETEPTVPGYTDERIYGITGTDEYVVIIATVESIDGEYAYMGQVPGIVNEILNSDGLEVGDRVMYIILRGSSYYHYKLEEDENYLGDHTPEALGYVDEEGRHVLTDEYINFFFGDNLTMDENTYIGMQGGRFTFEGPDYLNQYDAPPGMRMNYWDLQNGDRFYYLYNNQLGYMLSQNNYVLP